MSKKLSASSTTESVRGLAESISLRKGLDADGKLIYLKWVDQRKDTLGPVAGDLGRVMTTNEPFAVPVVNPADCEPSDLEGLTETQKKDIKSELRKEAEKARAKEVRELRKGWAAFYTALWATLSQESRDVAKAHADYSPSCEVDQNPNTLWRILRETHYTAEMGGGNEQLKLQKRLELRGVLANLKQPAGVPVAVFKRDYEQLIDRLEQMGDAKPSEAEQALAFIGKLDPARHQKMQVILQNNMLIGVAVPKTLQEAYELARDWKATPAAGAVHSLSAVFLTADEAEPPAPVLVTQPGVKTAGKGKQGGAEGSKKPYVERRKCYKCHQVGHLKAKCPVKDDGAVLLAEDDDASDEEAAYDRAFMLGTCGTCAEPQPMVDSDDEDTRTSDVVLFSPTEVILDCAAGKGVFRNSALLHDMRELQQPRRIGGVNASASDIVIRHEGVFADLGAVGHCPGAAANLLSQAELVDSGRAVWYDTERDEYTVKGDQRAWVFTRKRTPAGKSRFYTCDIGDMALVATVSDNVRRLTAREIKYVGKADVLLRRLGHMSARAGISLLNSGVLNCDVTAADMRNALAVHGPSLATLKGKTKKRASRIASGDTLVPRVTQVQQVLHVDVFFIKGLPFLLGILSPLGLFQCVGLADRGTDSIAAALQSFINTAASRDFEVLEVRSDGEGAVGVLATELKALGLQVSVAGPGQHVPVVERGIQTVKQRVRAHEHDLPYVMPALMLTWCTLFCVRSINLQPSATSVDSVSPQEQFSGLKLDAKRDLRAAFGDYVQATEPITDNSMSARTKGCIVLCPTGNLTGSVRMWCLATNRVVTRDQFTILPIPDMVIAYITAKAHKQGYERGADPTIETTPVDDEDDEPAPAGPQMMPIDGREDAPVQPQDAAQEAGVEYEEIAPNMDEPQHADAQSHVDELQVEEAPVPATDAPEAEALASQFGRRWSTRLQERRTSALNAVDRQMSVHDSELTRQLRLRAHWHDRDFAFNISVRAALRERADAAKEVILAELRQMVKKGVWHAVLARDLSPEQRRAIIRSTMFLKDKRLASGELDKFKARLVAGGDQQNRGLYENLSSPTAASASVLLLAAIAAAEHRHAVVIDIGGAFLNADMAPTGIVVHMRLDRLMTTMLLQIHSGYQKYVEENGTMVVALDKALYGCVEAAALWYNHLRGTLLRRGFRENKYDMCVFNMRTGGGLQISIALHVDDLLVTCAAEDELDRFHAYLTSVYPETKISRGRVLNYLGMTLDFTKDGEVSVTMVNCVQETLAEAGDVRGQAAPAGEDLFVVRDAPKATKAQAARFHSLVAKMLYLAKKSRPDCLTAVSFLTTRVHECDTDDLAKLDRVLGYLRASRSRGIVLRIGAKMEVRAYIDAAYGVHQDSGKSRTGCAVIVGEGGPILCKSSKQKIVTKSSTEAELVGLSDTASQAIHVRNFLVEQGHIVGPVIIYQDNTSAMALVRRGGPGSERSRHINIRYFWICERVRDGEVVVEHMPTERMLANILTKPVTGKQFADERAALTNWPDAPGAR